LWLALICSARLAFNAALPDCPLQIPEITCMSFVRGCDGRDSRDG
jgi:hypothetical protein